MTDEEFIATLPNGDDNPRQIGERMWRWETGQQFNGRALYLRSPVLSSDRDDSWLYLVLIDPKGAVDRWDMDLGDWVGCTGETYKGYPLEQRCKLLEALVKLGELR